MTDPSETAPPLPLEQPEPLTHDPRLLALREQACPVIPVRVAHDAAAWLLTEHSAIRAMYQDPHLGRTHPHPSAAARLGDNPVLHGPSELYTHADEHAEHLEARRLLSGFFSARRIAALTPGITSTVTELLAEMETAPRPVDLHEAFSYPLPLRVLCEVLGVPFTERRRFTAMVRRMDGRDASGAVRAHHDLVGHLREVTAFLRGRGDDGSVIAGLCAQGLEDEQVAGFASLLLFAGHESTAFHIDLGVLLLTRDRTLLRRLADDPDLVAGAVEEILRLGDRTATGFPRYARTDLRLADRAVARGDAVVPSLALANVDPRVFENPFVFDVERRPNPHLTFGHGAWHCLGAPLARVVLRAAVTGLATRFPDLRPAVPVERLARGDSGVAPLPVRW
ncbi:cytochrome P450 [Actinoalloteichus hoggarensis]|uniref:Pentalenolactone synthase n=1 Tax=Actinoalloteichus hoggarensis TaxID=1470176 RepID=A0A221W4I6_9PSEU|nr:cytochrome P450 [Actinoalloteichus hoggarensis]ASO20623.1 Pentalenolactone synthase [Actinoalloteichus hoggarensis]MBB5923664.1 cytochrome P450 [Actinoalloteichus hoggarensis]